MCLATAVCNVGSEKRGPSYRSLERLIMDAAKIRLIIFGVALVAIVGVTVFQANAILGGLAKLHH